jgi:antitoxin VapB
MAMSQPRKARVFMSGRSQAVRIPAEFRFSADEVYVRRDQQTGELILSEARPLTWAEIFALIDEADFPAEFMADRRQGIAETREPL